MELNKTYAVALLLFIIFPVALSLKNNGFRVELSHIDSKSNFTQIELLTRATARTRHRFSWLTGMQLFSSENASSSVQYGSDAGEYLMDLAIGKPPLNYSAIIDTGSDLIWTQCTPYKKSVSSQPTPLYDPSKSSTVSSIPCNNTFYQLLCATFTNYPPPYCLCSYNYTYGTGWTSGTLKRETFTFGTNNPVQFSSTVFGCSSSNSDNFNGTSGLVGFGRGPLSLPSQLNTSMFSYCLGSFLNSSSKSTLFIGPWATFSGSDVKSTSFVKSPSKSLSSFYYISLLGISLGTTNLGIQPSVFALQSNGEGGVVIDSGTGFTRLVNNAYQVVQNAVSSIMTLRRVDVPEDVWPGSLCYNLPSGTSMPSMPNMTLHFEGADMVLPRENYMTSVPYDKDSLLCLAIFNSTYSTSILGYYQQQNFHILYDISKEVLSFAPARCETI